MTCFAGGSRVVGLTYGPITSSIDDKKARRRMLYNTSAPIIDINKLKGCPSIKEGGSGESSLLSVFKLLYTPTHIAAIGFKNILPNRSKNMFPF